MMMARERSPPAQPPQSQPASQAGTKSNGDVLSPEIPDFNRRQSLTRAATFAEPLGLKDRRRSSSRVSDISLDSLKQATTDVRSTLFPSQEDLLQSRRGDDHELGISHEDSHWHALPLAFALVPALIGIIFQNGSAVGTDVMLLSLAGIFLHWSVKLPWDWYHSARKVQDPSPILPSEVESEGEDALSTTTSEAATAPSEARSPVRSQSKRRSSSPTSSRPMDTVPAENELRRHELTALLACFVLPACGAYLLHAIRDQLSRPSEGLVSNSSLTIFLLAAELRPAAHVLKIIRKRTLYLQRVVQETPEYRNSLEQQLMALQQQVEDLETSQISRRGTLTSNDEETKGAMAAAVKAEVRQSIQAELDALSRAVRRQERRATMLIEATEGRFTSVERKVDDSWSLAASAARRDQQRSSGVFNVLLNAVKNVMHFVQLLFLEIAILPFRALRGLSATLSSVFYNVFGAQQRRERAVKAPTRTSTRRRGTGAASKRTQ